MQSGFTPAPHPAEIRPARRALHPTSFLFPVMKSRSLLARSIFLGLLLLLPAAAQDVTQLWTFTGVAEGTPFTAVPNTATASGRKATFSGVLPHILVQNETLVVASSVDTQVYTDNLGIRAGRYQLELHLSSWNISDGGRTTLHFGFTGNTSGVVTADITIEADSGGLKIYGRSLGSGAANTPTHILPATGNDVVLRLLVDFDDKTTFLMVSDPAKGGTFTQVGQGAIARDRTGAHLRVRATGDWSASPQAVRIGQFNMAKL